MHLVIPDSPGAARLAVVSVGQQHDEARLAQPLGLAAGQELVKDDLRERGGRAGRSMRVCMCVCACMWCVCVSGVVRRKARFGPLPSGAPSPHPHPTPPSPPTDDLEPHLRPVCKVAELRLPQRQAVGGLHGEAPLKAEHAKLRQAAVADGQLAGLLAREHVGQARVLLAFWG